MKTIKSRIVDFNIILHIAVVMELENIVYYRINQSHINA